MGRVGSQLSALHCPEQRKQEWGDRGLWCSEIWGKDLEVLTVFCVPDTPVSLENLLVYQE